MFKAEQGIFTFICVFGLFYLIYFGFGFVFGSTMQHKSALIQTVNSTALVNGNTQHPHICVFRLIVALLKAQVSLQLGKVFSSDDGVSVSIMYSYMY